MVPIIGQVSSEDVELTGNHPPSVSNFHLIFGGQKYSELVGKERQRRHRGVLPRAEATK